MPVIAMTQEMGSLAKDVALQLGQSLGLAVMRHEALLADMALEARVRVALKDSAETRDTNITINANRGWVTLQGIVLNAEERIQAERVAGAVHGVAELVNGLRLMASSRLFTSAKYS